MRRWRGRLRTAQRIWRKHAEATRRFAKKSSHWSPKATPGTHSLKCPLSVALFLRPSLVASLGHTASRHRSARAEWARCITRRTRLNRNVAIKVLPPQWTADRQRRTCFEREARAVAALKHPNICTIYDIGHDDGTDFLVMELVEGESLAARLSRGPLPCEASSARSRSRARSTKRNVMASSIATSNPATWMLRAARTSRGAHAKLLDFGLARIVSLDMTAQLSSGSDASMTEGGGLFGTVDMAPEQIKAHQRTPLPTCSHSARSSTKC